MIAALIRPPLIFEAAPEGGVGHLRLHRGGGGMVKGGPPFLVVGGRLHPGQSGLHTTLPWVQPTPPWLPVPPWVQFKFPRVINFDSPLNAMTLGNWNGPTPYKGWIPPERWVGGASILPPKPTAQGGFFPPERWVEGASKC